MEKAIKKSTKNCTNNICSSQKNTQKNGKGDKVRPFAKKKYDKNYESINWKRN